ncbi:cytochrome c [Sulfurimonas sp.]|uniref:c-type cytochrome n=1 Tax=Sulfurimonas sp. TaxID=2022749 RepID=UPI00262D5468|nr:cytochrome c [Sulfurimonas sp.]
MKIQILLISLVTSVSLFAQSAQEIMQENGCLSCHAIASMKNAPAFAGIGRRNKRFYADEAKSVIINSIQNGSKGKYPRFSDSAMPPFNNLSLGELNILANYILAQSSKAKGRSGKGQGRGMGQGMMR